MFVAILALIVAMGGSAYAIQRAQSGDSLIAKRTLSGNRLRVNTVTGTEVANLQWHNLQLINGWENYWGNQRPPAWAIDVQGVVHFRGAIDGGSSAQFTTLPASIRTSVSLYIVTNLSGGAPGRIYINEDGSTYADYWDTFAAAQDFTSLEGVTYALNQH